MDKYFVGNIGGEFNWKRIDTEPTNAETSMLYKSGNYTAEVYFEKAQDKADFINIMARYL